MTPSAKGDLLLAKWPVFPGDFKALRQLPQLAERVIRSFCAVLIMLFWPSANCKLGGPPNCLRSSKQHTGQVEIDQKGNHIGQSQRDRAGGELRVALQ